MEVNKGYIPSQEQFQIVIDTLDKADKLCPYGKVDMSCATVDNECGSPMCHAGWYAFVTDAGKSYVDGAKMMATDLGIPNGWHLEEWAGDNPKIWGNTHGANLFCSDTAFGLIDGQLTSISQIVEHWKEVKKRAFNIENSL